MTFCYTFHWWHVPLAVVILWLLSGALCIAFGLMLMRGPR